LKADQEAKEMEELAIAVEENIRSEYPAANEPTHTDYK